MSMFAGTFLVLFSDIFLMDSLQLDVLKSSVFCIIPGKLGKYCGSWMSCQVSIFIRWHRTGSTLAQVMAYCLAAPHHHLNQSWPIINEVMWLSALGRFMKDISVTNHNNWLENYLPKIPFNSLRGHWFKQMCKWWNDNWNSFQCQLFMHLFYT